MHLTIGAYLALGYLRSMRNGIYVVVNRKHRLLVTTLLRLKRANKKKYLNNQIIPVMNIKGY
jgi:hypothetical protein